MIEMLCEYREMPQGNVLFFFFVACQNSRRQIGKRQTRGLFCVAQAMNIAQHFVLSCCTKANATVKQRVAPLHCMKEPTGQESLEVQSATHRVE
jgi:hypothetical protein